MCRPLPMARESSMSMCLFCFSLLGFLISIFSRPKRRRISLTQETGDVTNIRPSNRNLLVPPHHRWISKRVSA